MRLMKLENLVVQMKEINNYFKNLKLKLDNNKKKNAW